ncbi:unnamed protein product [Enterobius vermicularis]|uniref:Acyl_transf_3 domain-containing protein n=1 Tax=Enterobius vermicularis TaxID=51028 RepID=A0A0N4V492_ENTVE|nr:unnamed protein product [Enterobius vermicularis]
MILLRERPSSLEHFIIFYKKRIKRIFPAYHLMLFLFVFCGWQLLTSTDYFTLRKDAIWAACFATNINKHWKNLDYFAGVITSYDFLLHTWSLAVEIQFYIVAPILVFTLSLPFVGKPLWYSVFIFSAYYNATSFGPVQFSSLQSRMWQFMCGAVAHLLPRGVYFEKFRTHQLF